MRIHRGQRAFSIQTCLSARVRRVLLPWILLSSQLNAQTPECGPCVCRSVRPARVTAKVVYSLYFSSGTAMAIFAPNGLRVRGPRDTAAIPVFLVGFVFRKYRDRSFVKRQKNIYGPSDAAEEKRRCVSAHSRSLKADLTSRARVFINAFETKRVFDSRRLYYILFARGWVSAKRDVRQPRTHAGA